MSLPGPVICIVGPTASGKSALAEELAVRLGSSVVSVDAMQVYRGMDIGTAKTPVQRRRCPLLMVDVADPDQEYSVALYQREARACVDELLAEGRTPVLCGGSGLYMDAVIDQMEFPKGDVGDQVRQRYERLCQESGPQAVYDLLRRRDPDSAALIHPHNVRRVIRALELLDHGQSYSQQHEGLKNRPPHYAARIWGIAMDRDRLYRRIDRRVDQMFDDGLVDEVKGLCAQGFEGAITSRQAIGYKEVVDALAGRTTMDEARDLIKRGTRRYAKRQLSWLRRDGRANWIDADSVSLEQAVQTILDDLLHASAKEEHHS
ncbi:MAG: tRNA (adenosine(37)-N6)-dimethylallyltransferase MiaA [Coriobacteriales bacterium]|nr:tRNA (adenosine(37)-N6)-dimethylallyltransferase MiaA [Coriobacteriales bacterium]